MSENEKNVKLANKNDNSKQLQKDFEKIKGMKKQFRSKKYIGGILNFLIKYRIDKLEYKYRKENNKVIKSIGSGDDTLDEDRIEKMEAFKNYLIGTDYNLNPVYVNNLNQHLTVFGASGSGKSVFLFNILRQTLEKGGGACMIDGKGDMSMFQDFKRFADDFGRTEDILLLNFNLGAESTNSFSIFEALSIDDCETIISGIAVPKAKDFFDGQAKNYIKHLFNILRFLQYKGTKIYIKTLNALLDLNVLLVQKVPPSKDNPKVPDPDWIKWNGFEGVVDYWVEKEFTVNNDPVAKSIVDFADQYKTEINTEDTGDPTFEMNEQFMTQIGGYSAMRLKVVTDLSNTFDKIFNATKNDINFVDVIAQNKLVYCVIPNMKLDAAVVNSIGSFLITAIKNAVGTSLGKEAIIPEGAYYNFNGVQIKANPFFPLILDEMTAFVQDSKRAIGDLMSQARSVNVATIVSSQDVASLSKGEDGQNFVDQIFSNASTQVYLKVLDDPTIKKAQNILISKESVVDEKGNKQEKYEKSEMEAYLRTCKNGLGIILSKDIDKFLTPWVEPKSQDKSFVVNK